MIITAESKSTQVVVVGAGPGGYAAAFRAADLGLDVTLIDLEPNPGGVCLYRGCIPSKALLHAAKVLIDAREADAFGIEFAEPNINLEKLRSWKQDVVRKMTGGLGQLSKRRGIQYIQGRARFEDSKTLKVETADNGTQKIEFDNLILATGSKPAEIPNLPIDSSRIISSTGALALKDIPKTLLVVGGGYIGLELGYVYATLGSQVSVVEMMSSLLPGVDADLVKPLSKRIEGIFDAVMLDSRVMEMKEQKNGIKVKIEGENGDESGRIFEKVLVAVGRKPNYEGLNIEAAGVELSDRGFVKVDGQRRTSTPSIFAIGDIAGEPMLAHKASHEGFVAAETIAGEKAAFEPRAIPAVVFTDPEIAWCGVTETEAKDQGMNVEVARFHWAASGRATTLGRNDGLTKLIVDPETERVLGVGIVGNSAGELIAEGVLAIEMGAFVSDIEMTIHAHPTLSETVMESAELFHGHCTHLYRPKKRR